MAGASQDWEAFRDDTYRFSLRFTACTREQAFVNQRSHPLRWGSMLCCAFAIVVLLLSLVFSPGYQNEGIQGFRNIAQVACVLFLACVFAGHPRLEPCIKAFLLEYLITGGLVVTLVFIMLAEPLAICRMLREDPEQELLPHQRLHHPYLLTNVLLVAAANACLQLRWCFLLLFDVSAFVIATSTTLMASASPDSPATDILQLALVYATICWGRRQCEIFERMSFRRNLVEKVRRFESEHQLSRAMESRCEPLHDRPADTTSMTSSLPETTTTGRVFGELRTSEAMDQVCGLGRKEQWLIGEEELDIFSHREAILGRGGFGLVCLGYFHGSAVAIKVPRRRGAGKPLRVEDLVNELRILRKLRHPHLVLLHGAVVHESGADFALVLELVRGETLGAFVEGDIEPSAPQKLESLVGISLALMYLHSRQPCIVHSDLKPANIMVQRMRHPGFARAIVHPKILDFGLARLRTSHSRIGGGTAGWCAPEMVDGASRTPLPSVDVFAFGQVSFYVALRRHPIRGGPPRLQCGGQQWPDEALFAQIAEPCLLQEAASRPTMPSVNGRLLDVLASHFAGESPYQAFRIPDRDRPMLPTEDPGRFWPVVEELRKPNPQLVTLLPRMTGGAEPTAAGAASAPEAPAPACSASPERPRSAGSKGRLGSNGTKSSRSPTDNTTRQASLGGEMDAVPEDFPLARQETQPEILEESLQRLLRRWHLQSLPGECCSWHSAVRLASSLLRRMERAPCRKLSRARELQCPVCHLYMQPRRHHCDMCSDMCKDTDASNTASVEEPDPAAARGEGNRGLSL